jgi:hypothetical protein
MRTLFALVLTLVASSCASQTLLSGEKDAWFERKEGSFRDLYYCRSNETKDGKAYPTCYEATWNPGGALPPSSSGKTGP